MVHPLAAHLDEQLRQLAARPQGIATGLSGGGDSWALTLLAHDYCRKHDLPFVALTVDHRLRADSTAEAQGVAAECAKRGIPHQSLTWAHDSIDSRKQEQARSARYDLMGDYCAANNFSHLLVAHHADDQAETVLLRFAKASGSAGLAAMPAQRPLNDKVTLCRPLLDVPKADLILYAEAAGAPIIEDPSNNHPDYARARLRAAKEVLAREGLTTQTLLKVAAVAREEAEALNHAARQLILRQLTNPDQLPVEAWRQAPIALQRIAWLEIWRQVTGSTAYPPDRDSITDLCHALGLGPTRRTLGGMISEHKVVKGQEWLRFYPEKSGKLIVS